MQTRTLEPVDALTNRLLTILARSSDGAVSIDPGEAERPLRELGITSVAILNFLVAIEDDLSMEWSPDQPRETFRSIASIAETLRDAYHVSL